EQLYREIEKRYATSKQKDEEFRVLLKAMGAQLFNQLLPPTLQSILWRQKDRIDAIQVISTEPFVPWELVILKDPNEKGIRDGKFLAEMGLTRWVHGSWHPPVVRVRGGRSHYVVPDYPNPAKYLSEAEAEAEFVSQRLGAESVRATLKEV